MPALLIASRIRAVAALGALFLVGIGPASRAQDAPGGADREKALELCREHKELEALPLLEALHKAAPDDRVIQERLACALAVHSGTLSDEDATAPILRCRKLLQDLKATGPLSILGEAILESTPAGGKRAPASTRREAAAAMREGEAAFARREFDKALAAYERALIFDPKLASAALFAGDAWFARGKMEEAIPWFAKAAAIDPDQPAPLRYWGDALVKQGKMGEARSKFLDAILLEPYSQRTWGSLAQWADRNAIPAAHPRVLPPDLGPGKNRVARAEDGTRHVALYYARRAEWKDKRFANAFPDEPEYRHSLREEADALRQVAGAVRAGMKDGTITAPDPSLAKLVEIDDAGLLEPYVLLARPDEGIARDYAAYRERNRGKLLAYLSSYVAPYKNEKAK